MEIYSGKVLNAWKRVYTCAVNSLIHTVEINVHLCSDDNNQVSSDNRPKKHLVRQSDARMAHFVVIGTYEKHEKTFKLTKGTFKLRKNKTGMDRFQDCCKA